MNGPGGICGWFSAGPAAMPLAEMAAPLGAASCDAAQRPASASYTAR